MAEALLILGASARAAAQSARRAGFAPICGDLFADLDLRRCAQATAVAEFPRGFGSLARAAPPCGWMYTGGMENHAGLVARIAAARPLWGNPGEVLKHVRDPMQVAAALRRAGLDAPACYATERELRRTEFIPPLVSRATQSTTKRWLRKPRYSSGGSRIEFWPPGGRHKGAPNRGWYFQEWIEGQSCAAVYVGARGRAVLLGVTEQLLVADRNGQPAFRYAGSAGPIPLAPASLATFVRIGEVLAAEFDLRGLFGVDAILRDERVWPIEVNPRYPASVEILEWATGVSAVGCHVHACREHKLPVSGAATSGRWYAKRIHFARHEAVVTPAFSELVEARNAHRLWPAVADIPAVGSRFRAGQPVATFLAEGAGRDEVLEGLAEAENELATNLGQKSIFCPVQGSNPP